jgi:putative transcription antitermination factor YqgF
MNILCIDYGTKRIGVAIATTPIAQPIGVIPNSKNPKLTDIITDSALDQIVKLTNEFSIEKILVGISEGEMAKKTRTFIEKLTQKIHIPIEEVDETLSSSEATDRMRHMSKTKRQGDRDHIAAAVILQDYLDLHE